MDLKDVIKQVQDSSNEATLAFMSGHHDVAEQYLYETVKVIAAYLKLPAPPASDVTKSATTEKADEVQKDTPAKALGGAAHLAGHDSVYGPQKGGQALGEKKLTQ